jgi:hypothetical protein
MRKIDIKGGQFTYAQRIELGRIMAGPGEETAKMIACMKCLVPGWSFLNIRASIKWWPEVVEGLHYWIQRENKELHKSPSAEERAAGIADLQRRVGYMGVVTTIAKEYGVDPDTVLSWKYGKVFNLLYTDMQRALFRERIEKNREMKRKQKRK